MEPPTTYDPDVDAIERRARDVSDLEPTRWAVMRFMTLVTPTGEVYLSRARILQTPWFSIYLHRLDVPDPGVDLHDHPWWFASLILRGGYDEEIADARHAPAHARFAEQHKAPHRGVVRSRRAGSVHRVRLGEAHRIFNLHRSPTWTLVLTGVRRRSWGFFQPDGFIDRRDYDFVVRRNLGEAPLMARYAATGSGS